MNGKAEEVARAVDMRTCVYTCLISDIKIEPEPRVVVAGLREGQGWVILPR